MILTEKFVFLQFPRTGTRFCEKAIIETMPAAAHKPGKWGNHNYRSDIPRDWEDLPIIGVTRDVVDLWTSWFNSDIVISLNSFEKYYDLVNTTGGGVRYGEMCIGGFMGKYRKIMFGKRWDNFDDVRFLDFDNLNEELYNLLKEYGYDNPTILDAQPVGVSKKGGIPPYMIDRIQMEESWN